MQLSPTDRPSLADRRGLDRQVLRLALPALGALIAEPLFILADSAMVGHLGTTELAGLGLASSLLLTIVGLFVFLAYSTTASVGRLLGAGQQDRALRAGVEGIWLAALIGTAVAAIGFALAPWLITQLGGVGEVADQSVIYLRTSLPGLPGMLVVLAATGVLRGMLNTRTPLVVAGVGALANAVLNAVLIYGLHWGIAGSGTGTAIVQLAMGGYLATLIFREAKRRGVAGSPSLSGLGDGARTGLPLFIRTLTLRAAILLTVSVAATFGATSLAGYQIVNSLWGFAAFALDALAIAAQALVGRTLGAGEPTLARGVLDRTLLWGVGAGAILGALLAILAWPLTALFTSQDSVREAAVAGIYVIAIAMPLAGLVYLLDGVLIGAGDARFLAWAGLASLAAYLPMLWIVRSFAPPGDAVGDLVRLWTAFAVGFMAARGIATWWRSRTDAWLTLGA